MSRNAGSKHALMRGTAGLLALWLVALQAPMATGAPGDIFTVAAPAIGDAPPAATGIADGDSGVSTSTGAFTYSYPIAVAPGRNGMQPGIALSYSSQAPIYGGIAAGWSVSGLPIITEDTSGGRLWSTAFSVPITRYQSSMAGNRPLVVVSEPTPAGTTAYRAQNDASFVRYQQFDATTAGYHWRALSPDGMITYFGHTDAHTGDCTTISDGYAPVTRIEDPFGNLVDFYYRAGVDGECRITAITWGQHVLSNGAGTFGQVLFTYAPAPQLCSGVAVGSQASYRTGTKIVTGASKLEKIEAFAFEPTSSTGGTAPPPPTTPEHHRTITLTYAETTTSCSGFHAPYRALASIKETAVRSGSPEIELPAIDFTYGDAAVAYGTGTFPNVPWSGVPAERYNLGWGLRPDGQWPTVEAMMLDLDGDGLIDRIESEPVTDAATGQHRLCAARWYRNPGGGGTFEDRGLIEIPTIKWASEPGGGFTGGAHAVVNQATGLHERCALNYQQSGYTNSTGTVVGCPPDGTATCPLQISSTQGWCATSTQSDCGNKNFGFGNQDTRFAWRWMDVNGDQRPDLVGSPVTGGIGRYDLQWGNMVDAPQEPGIFGAFPACPSTPYTADPTSWPTDPYTMCGGMFPWFVYLNHGSEAAGLRRRIFGKDRPGGSGTSHATWGREPDYILYQPIPLESTNGDSSLTSSPVGQYVGTVDIDGDGFADAVHHSWANANVWNVFRNDGTGQLRGKGIDPFVFGTNSNGSNFHLSRSGYTPSAEPNPVGVEGLEDLNGDGLVDHWVSTDNPVDPTEASLQMNDGLQFRPNDGTTIDRSGPDGTPWPGTVTTSGIPTHYVCQGTRVDARRTSDLDDDGRPDLLQFTSPSSFTAGARYNVGAAYTDTAWALGDGALHRIVLRSSFPSQPCDSAAKRTWELDADLIDLDGDGLKEDAFLSSTTQTMFVRKRESSAPPRLLTSVTNNRGATTTITYSSMNGPAVVQAPDENKASPSTSWVVQSVSTVDDFAGTTTTTSYKYTNPHWAPDADAGRPQASGFRGFEEVETTAQSGAVTIERFSFDPDWSGRLTTKIVKPSSGDDVHTIDETSWEARTLFGGDITTYHATMADHWTCKNGQNESACRANTDTRTHTETTWLPRTSTTDSSTILLWHAAKTRLGTSPLLSTGDRETSTSADLFSDADVYRLRPRETIKNLRVSSGWQMYGRSVASWDATYRVQLTSEIWVDADYQNRLISRSVYDMTTGNVVEHWKPKQNAANTTRTVLTYDSRKLFPATETNEKGHLREFTWDYGTGTKLITDGPNVRLCIPGPNCPEDEAHPIKEREQIVIDAIGRMLERWTVYGDNGQLYTLTKIETNSYTEATSSTPASVTHRTRIDHLDVPTPRWTEDVSELDGHGRPIRGITKVFGTAPADAITTYQYADDGTLVGVTVPDPTANDASTVTYSYGYDSLGRPISIRRPDNANAAFASGVNIVYDGVSQTTTEVVPSGTAPALASTTTVNDAFGRLVRVEELADESTWQTTLYSYGADDLVRTVTDPEEVLTALTHDWAGRRTMITRPGGATGTECVDLVNSSTCRHWKYTYDANGNEIAEQVPGSPTPPTTDALYTTTTVYDDLDRPISRLIAPRNLSTADQELFGSHEIFAWDGASNGIGRLRRWTNYPPSGYWLQNYNYYVNSQQKPYSTLQQFRGAGFVLNRDAVEHWYPNGARRNLRHREFVGPNRSETWTGTKLDQRGLPQWLQLISRQDIGGTATYFAVADQTRNVAGLVTKRRTNLTTAMGAPSAGGYVESNWTYDKLGRVVDQTVQHSPDGSTPTQVVRQQLEYFGNDDPKTLTHHLGSSSRTFTFGYDRRHQLTSAVADTASYFNSAYTYGAAGRLASANIAQTINPTPPGSEVQPRNVDYVYGGTDPEHVTALTKANNPQQGSTIAAYTYDAAGNQITRSYPATDELWEYVYDGKDQLRRATKKVNGNVQGSEEYWYDNEGQRTQVVKRDENGNKTELIWFLKDTEFHYDASGALTKTYAHASLGTPVARIERTPAGGDTPTFEFQFHGLASNTIAAVAPDGTVNASFSYAPFGDVLEATDGGAIADAGVEAHQRRFNDKYQDDISGLTYYGFRYYDKHSMIWTQSDPLFRFAPDAAWIEPRNANLYSAHLNNPLRYIDPDGRLSDPIGPVIVRAAPAAANAASKVPGPPQVKAAVAVAVFAAVVGYVALKEIFRPGQTGQSADLGQHPHLEAMPIIPRGSPDQQTAQDDPPPDGGGPYRTPGVPTPPAKPKRPARPPLPTPGPEAPKPAEPKRSPSPFRLPDGTPIPLPDGEHPDFPAPPDKTKASTPVGPQKSGQSSPSSRSTSVEPFGCGIECVPSF